MQTINIIETKRLKLLPLNLDQINPDDNHKIARKLGLQLAGIILGKQIDEGIKASMRASLERVILDKKSGQWCADWQSVLIILKEGNEIIGGFCFQKYPEDGGTAQLGYTIRPEYQRNGYMTEALKTGVPWIFKNGNISSLQAQTTKSNLPSHKVLQKVGMAVYRETADSLWWEIKH
jgi:[ribosomal protein S5]-alanine N-acetyltransferase